MYVRACVSVSLCGRSVYFVCLFVTVLTNNVAGIVLAVLRVGSTAGGSS